MCFHQSEVPNDFAKKGNCLLNASLQQDLYFLRKNALDLTKKTAKV